jgi:hypothetical protein
MEAHPKERSAMSDDLFAGGNTIWPDAGDADTVGGSLAPGGHGDWLLDHHDPPVDPSGLAPGHPYAADAGQLTAKGAAHGDAHDKVHVATAYDPNFGTPGDVGGAAAWDGDWFPIDSGGLAGGHLAADHGSAASKVPLGSGPGPADLAGETKLPAAHGDADLKVPASVLDGIVPPGWGTGPKLHVVDPGEGNRQPGTGGDAIGEPQPGATQPESWLGEAAGDLYEELGGGVAGAFARTFLLSLGDLPGRVVDAVTLPVAAALGGEVRPISPWTAHLLEAPGEVLASQVRDLATQAMLLSPGLAPFAVTEILDQDVSILSSLVAAVRDGDEERVAAMAGSLAGQAALMVLTHYLGRALGGAREAGRLAGEVEGSGQRPWRSLVDDPLPPYAEADKRLFVKALAPLDAEPLLHEPRFVEVLAELARHEGNRHRVDAVVRVARGKSNTELRAQVGARVAEQARRVLWEGRYDEHLNPERCPVFQALIDLSQRRAPVVLVEEGYANGPFWEQVASKALRFGDAGAGKEHGKVIHLWDDLVADESLKGTVYEGGSHLLRADLAKAEGSIRTDARAGAASADEVIPIGRALWESVWDSISPSHSPEATAAALRAAFRAASGLEGIDLP